MPAKMLREDEAFRAYLRGEGSTGDEVLREVTRLDRTDRAQRFVYEMMHAATGGRKPVRGLKTVVEEDKVITEAKMQLNQRLHTVGYYSTDQIRIICYFIALKVDSLREIIVDKLAEKAKDPRNPWPLYDYGTSVEYWESLPDDRARLCKRNRGIRVGLSARESSKKLGECWKAVRSVDPSVQEIMHATMGDRQAILNLLKCTGISNYLADHLEEARMYI